MMVMVMVRVSQSYGKTSIFLPSVKRKQKKKAKHGISYSNGVPTVITAMVVKYRSEQGRMPVDIYLIFI